MASEDKKDEIIKLNSTYNCVMLSDDGLYVVLNEGYFIEIIESTIDKWYDVLILNDKDDCLETQEIISSIKVDYGEERTSFTIPSVKIKLTNGYELYYGYGYNISLQDFIYGALGFLKTNPIRLKHFVLGFHDSLEKKLGMLQNDFEVLCFRPSI